MNPVDASFEISAKKDPAAIVQRQLDAYNARDIETLLATYAEDAEHYEYPAKLLLKGRAEMRKRFLARFQEPNLHAELLHRIVANQTVIDHERVTRTFPDGPGTIELVMIYDIRAGRIAVATAILGTRSALPS